MSRARPETSVLQTSVLPAVAVFGSVFLAALAVPSDAVGARLLMPRARYDARAGEHFFELGVEVAGVPPSAASALGVRSLDRPDAYLIVDASGSEIVVRGAVAGELPRSFIVEVAEQRQRVDVDWSGAASDPMLTSRWRSSLREHFRGLLEDDSIAAFARFAIVRLDGSGSDSNRESFLRAQDLTRRSASTFDLTTGAIAIEESLQLERLRGTGRARNQTADTPLASIEGVTIRSHPWTEMLAGRDPSSAPIERFLPLDQYAFEARSFSALLELADWMDAYGTPLVEWTEERADDSGVKARIERQLCLPASAVARKLGPLVIGRVAATGGDPFLREGADLTLVFELKAAPLFFANLEKNRALAETHHPHTRRVELAYRDHQVRGIESPLRDISSYSALVDGHGLVSNSLAGLYRALDAFDGKTPSQDEGLDRKFVRTQLPSGDGEDAFLYLSDDAIRHLTGPALKLRESRRLECSASLRTIAYATAWRHVRGATPASDLAELSVAGDLPSELLFCPDAGRYSLVDDRRSGACSLHGSLEFLTPNVEIDLKYVTQEEKQAYERFRATYQSYWSRFFDPIGVRISLGDEKDGSRRRRIETIILPLIEMSEYRQMAELFGGEGVQKGPLFESGGDTALVVSAHLNRESSLFRMANSFLGSQVRGLALDWIGDRISVFVRDLPEAVAGGKEPRDIDDLLESVFDGYPGGVRIGVRNKLLLAGFLTALRAYIDTSSPDTVRFEVLPERHGKRIVRVGPTDSSGSGPGSGPRSGPGSGPDALYYVVAGDGLFLSLDRGTLDALIDREHVEGQGGATAGEARADDAGSPAAGAANDGTKSVVTASEHSGAVAEDTAWLDDTHVAFALDLAGAPRWRALLQNTYRELSAAKCAASRREVERFASLGLDTPASQRTLRGASPRCPLGGEIRRDEHGFAVCSHAAATPEPRAGEKDSADASDAGASPSRLDPLAALDRLRVSLRFTEEGVRTLVELDESPRGSR